MAATIVYDGVASGNPGSLFGNLKFWIAQRVPARNDLIGKIEVWPPACPIRSLWPALT